MMLILISKILKLYPTVFLPFCSSNKIIQRAVVTFTIEESIEISTVNILHKSAAQQSFTHTTNFCDSFDSLFVSGIRTQDAGSYNSGASYVCTSAACNHVFG